MKAFRGQPHTPHRFWVPLSEDWRVLHSAILRLEWLKEEKITNIQLTAMRSGPTEDAQITAPRGIFKYWKLSVLSKKISRRNMRES